MVGLIYPIGTELYVGAGVVGRGRAVVTVPITRGGEGGSYTRGVTAAPQPRTVESQNWQWSRV